MAKLKLDYSEFEILTKRLESLGGDVKKATEKALKKSQQYVQSNVERDMVKHRRTGDTIKAFERNPNVRWTRGTIAEIDVGFDIKRGGLPSIFLMYGTPRMKKDQKLFNDIYGKKTRDELLKIQEEVYFDAISKTGG